MNHTLKQQKHKQTSHQENDKKKKGLNTKDLSKFSKKRILEQLLTADLNYFFWQIKQGETEPCRQQKKRNAVRSRQKLFQNSFF